MELWAALDEVMRAAGSSEAAGAARVAVDAYLRSSEIFSLRAEDVIESQGVVALKLGGVERGERTKTGVRQGVRSPGCGCQATDPEGPEEAEGSDVRLRHGALQPGHLTGVRVAGRAATPPAPAPPCGPHPCG